ncbi:2-oxo acid dehydrogenase subunit E2 [Spiroplasma endosymbiont of Labia minor]|uniref:2-oxo acid dehydrogenase subunit E2 n=1 Tax=Spiroplasma endosymbiont of Labia minor TaxID=3066305 RepID=UPI0030CBBD6E
MLEHIKFKNDDYVKGVVEKVFVNHGQKVAADQSLAMISTQFKTYNIIAEKPGIIEDISIEPGMVINYNSRIFNINVRQDYLSNFETETIFDEFFMETLGDDLKYGTDNTIFRTKPSNKNNNNEKNVINENSSIIENNVIKDLNEKLSSKNYQHENSEGIKNKNTNNNDSVENDLREQITFQESINNDIGFSEIADILKPIITNEKEIENIDNEQNLSVPESFSNKNENENDLNYANITNENNSQMQNNVENSIVLNSEIEESNNNYELLKSEFKQTLDLVKNFQSNLQVKEPENNDQIVLELKNEINDLKNMIKELKRNYNVINVTNKHLNQKLNNENKQDINSKNSKIINESINNNKNKSESLQNESKIVKIDKTNSKNNSSINQIEAEFDITSLQTLYGVMNEAYANNKTNLPIETFYILALTKALNKYSTFNSTFDNPKEKMINNGNINVNCSVLIGASIHYVLIEKAELLGTQNLAKKINQKINDAKRIIDNNRNFILNGGSISLTDFNVLGINFGKINLISDQVAHIGIGVKNKRTIIIDGKMTDRIFANISLAYNEDLINLADAAAFLLHFGKILSSPGFLI